MEKRKIVKLIESYLRKFIKDNKKPGVSYIVSVLLRSPMFNNILVGTYSPEEILRIAYTVFYLFDGDDYVSAEWRSQKDLFVIDVYEIADLEGNYEDCSVCGGDGQMDCEECLGQGSEICFDCEGTGTDDGEECRSCDGSGNIVCDACYGDETIQCTKCEGTGEIELEDIITLTREIWITGNYELAEKIKEEGKDKNIIRDFYDTLDDKNNSGSLFLVRNVIDSQTIPLSEFEAEYGPYVEVEKDYIVNSVKNLNDSNLDLNIKDGSSPTIG